MPCYFNNAINCCVISISKIVISYIYKIHLLTVAFRISYIQTENNKFCHYGNSYQCTCAKTENHLKIEKEEIE